MKNLSFCFADEWSFFQVFSQFLFELLCLLRQDKVQPPSEADKAKREKLFLKK
jgi:hypothetical protein